MSINDQEIAKFDPSGNVKIQAQGATGKVVTGFKGQIKAAAGVLRSLFLSFYAATVGDKIEIKDNTSDAGDVLLTILCPTTGGIAAFTPSVGITFGTGIYYAITTAATGSSFALSAVYE